MKCRFRLTNSTGRDVKIVDVVNQKPCCGTLSVDKAVLGPGDYANVEVTLQVGGRFGNVTHLAEVVTDLPGSESIVLRTSANAVPAIRIAEDSSAMTTVLVGDRAPRTLELRADASGTPTEPPADLGGVELRSTIAVRWAGPKEPSPAEEGLVVESRRFIATLDSSGEPGERRADILLQDGERVLFDHVLRWEVVPRLQASPNVIVMQPGEREYRVTIRSRDNTPFRIKRTECAAMGIKCRPASAAPGITQTVRIEGSPSPNSGRGAVVVFTDHPAQEKVAIPLVVVN
jgi:hypothetical protein